MSSSEAPPTDAAYRLDPGLVAIVASNHSLAATLSAGAVVALIALVALMRFQHAAWRLAAH